MTRARVAGAGSWAQCTVAVTIVCPRQAPSHLMSCIRAVVGAVRCDVLLQLRHQSSFFLFSNPSQVLPSQLET